MVDTVLNVMFSSDWRTFKCSREYRKLRTAACLIQKHVKAWVARVKYRKLKWACVFMQKNVRRYVTQKEFLKTCKAAITIQKYARGWSARRKYEAAMHQTIVRPYSRQSIVSMNSLGYYSLTTSTSVYSLNPSLLDVSPGDPAFGDLGAVALSGEALKAYLSPEHHQRLLETEESGIETDTESINGDVSRLGTRRSKRLRRRSQLQELLRGRARAKIPCIESEESMDDEPDQLPAQTTKVEDFSCKSERMADHNTTRSNVTKLDHKPRNLFIPQSPKNVRHSSDDKAGRRNSGCVNIVQKMRVATMRDVHEVSEILKDYSPSESLQMVLPKQNLSLFFKNGVLSYRRMPTVCMQYSAGGEIKTA